MHFLHILQKTAKPTVAYLQLNAVIAVDTGVCFAYEVTNY